MLNFTIEKNLSIIKNIRENKVLRIQITQQEKTIEENVPGFRSSTGIERDRRVGSLVQAPVMRGHGPGRAT